MTVTSSWGSSLLGHTGNFLQRADHSFNRFPADAAGAQNDRWRQVASSTVDSSPIRLEPASRIKGMRPRRSLKTCWAVVGLGKPERLALGAATGRSTASMRASAT